MKLSLLPLLVIISPVFASSESPLSLSRARWLTSWTTMPQLCESTNLPPAPFTQPNSVFLNSTLRQSFKISRSGAYFRLRISNAFGPTSLDITRVTVALPLNASAVGTSAINTKTLKQVTFGGDAGFSITDQSQAVSDPFSLDGLKENGAITVSMYLASGQAGNNITAHPGSRTTSYFVFGDQTTVGDVAPLGSNVTTAEHWYFISAFEVVSLDPKTTAIAIVGDSITDGRGSTENQNDRWPDQFYTRLRADPLTPLTYLNQAAGGNRVLLDILGPSAISRIDRDVLAQSQVSHVIIFEGVNDIGVADATVSAQALITHQLIVGFEQIITRLRSQRTGLKIYGATITPFGGNNPYDDGAGIREKSRAEVNSWIRTSGWYDAVLDFDKAVRDPTNTTRLDPTIDVGDHLHMNPEGYRRIAASIPLSLFL